MVDQVRALAAGAAEAAETAWSFARAKIIAERVLDALFQDVETENDGSREMLLACSMVMKLIVNEVAAGENIEQCDVLLNVADDMNRLAALSDDPL